MMAKFVAWESLIGWFACVNFVYKVCLVALVMYFKSCWLIAVGGALIVHVLTGEYYRGKYSYPCKKSEVKSEGAYFQRRGIFGYNYHNLQSSPHHREYNRQVELHLCCAAGRI